MVTHYMLRTHEGKWIKNQFMTALDVIKCLEQVDIAPYVRTSL